MKLIICIVFLIFLSCSSTSTVYVTCKYNNSNDKELKVSLQTQLRNTQTLISYKKVDTGLYEVLVKE